MSEQRQSCPMSRSQVLDAYFMDNRAKLLDIAAFLDRFDRAGDDGSNSDFRIASFREALNTVVNSDSDRAAAILEILSDHTEDPLESAAGMKGAHGAWPKFSEGGN